MFPTLQRIDLGILAFLEQWITHPIERTLGVTNFALARATILLVICGVYVENTVFAELTPWRGVAMLLAISVCYFVGAVMVKNVERQAHDAMRRSCASPMKHHPGMQCVRLLWMFLFLPLMLFLFALREQWWNMLFICVFMCLIMFVSLDSLPPGSTSRLTKLLRAIFPRRTQTA